MSRRRGLGRGLDALLGGTELVEERTTSDTGVGNIAVDQIRRGKFQPRRSFPEATLRELADSLRAQGMVQPVVVRPVDDGYELVAGERRWRAAQLAGLHEIPAVVRDLDDRASAAVGLIENIQREELNALEEAEALARLTGEFELTHQEVAEAVGRSRAAVSNLLRLLDLHDEVKRLLVAGELEMGHARALLGAPRERQPTLAGKVVSAGLNVRQTETLVRGSEKPAPRAPGNRRDPDIMALEQRLGEQLGAAVSVTHRANGSGSLTVKYHSLDELEGILEHIH
ncbi:MAG: ParB/RepB/Spo0J family partition protein [Gammaproteobacteria bacterium]|nr:ParB/RepB/Spo0J family partition protein [Gammaproteobacteria bacterium]